MSKRAVCRRAGLVLAVTLSSCIPGVSEWSDVHEDGSFLMYRRQSLIGEETFSIRSDGDSIVVRSLQGENERGRVTGVETELRLGQDLSPALYRSRRISDSDTTNILEVVATAQGVSVREKETDAVSLSAPDGFFPRTRQRPGCSRGDVVPPPPRAGARCLTDPATRRGRDDAPRDRCRSDRGIGRLARALRGGGHQLGVSARSG